MSSCKTSPCKDCPDRCTACHDRCERFRAWQVEREKENAYNRGLTRFGCVYHYGHDDKHRETGRKRYFDKNGGADR